MGGGVSRPPPARHGSVRPVLSPATRTTPIDDRDRPQLLFARITPKQRRSRQMVKTFSPFGAFTAIPPTRDDGHGAPRRSADPQTRRRSVHHATIAPHETPSSEKPGPLENARAGRRPARLHAGDALVSLLRHASTNVRASAFLHRFFVTNFPRTVVPRGRRFMRPSVPTHRLGRSGFLGGGAVAAGHLVPSEVHDLRTSDHTNRVCTLRSSRSANFRPHKPYLLPRSSRSVGLFELAPDLLGLIVGVLVDGGIHLTRSFTGAWPGPSRVKPGPRMRRPPTPGLPKR